MDTNVKVRWGWLKVMYYYTIFGAGGFGLGMIMIPDRIISWFGYPVQDPIIFGIAGSVYVAFIVRISSYLKQTLLEQQLGA